MKKILILAVVLGLAALWWWKYKTPAQTGQTNQPGAVNKAQTEEFSGTLAQAMKLGVPMKCDWQSAEGSGESYVKGNDMYVKTQVEGKVGMMMKKGDCVYTWSEAEKQGVKFCQALPTPAAAGTEADSNLPDSGSYQAQGVDLNVQYKCRPDIFSGDRFELPADVQFLDMESALKGFKP